MNYSDKEVFLIALDSATSLEYKHKYAIYQRTKDVDGFEKKKNVAIDCIGSLGDANILKAFVNLFNGEYIDYLLKDLAKTQVTAITIDSEDYSDSLKEIENPPLVLYAKGNVKLLKEKSIAIVGSRKSLPLSISICENFTEKLVDGGFTVVTGIAEGVDVTALRKCLAKNGKVISVLAGGLGNLYPKAHQDIFDKVCEKGLAISEHTYNTQSMPYMFPIRNRIIAGLAKGVLVVNGSKKSGTLYTAEFAMENGRDLFAVPYSVGVKSGEGSNDLIKRGATLVDSPNDILDYYGIEKEEKPFLSLSENEEKIILAIEEGKYHVEEIADFVNLSVTEVSTVLALMEIKRIVVKDGINQYGLAK